MRSFLISFCLVFFTSQALFSQEISEKYLHKHIAFLASDKLKGRSTGSPECMKAAKYIAKQFKKIGLQPKGDNGTFFHQYEFKRSSDPHSAPNGPQEYAQNVVGYIDNGAANTIVIGGHYDHLGLGHDHNSLEANPEGKIHNGADDNASGTAGVIELARYYANNGVKEQHNFLFICFSGEELGLFGSKKYTDSPTIDLSKVSFMLNMDMIGRLNAERRIMVGGVGTAPDFVPTITKFKGDFTIKFDSSGVGPSDHTSFYLKNIPVLFFFTGQHSDYHKPSDDVEKINFPGEQQLLEMAVRVVNELDKTPKLQFQETKVSKDSSPSFTVTLGIMPDYTYEGEGLHVDGVTNGKCGFKAGLQKGDIIVRLGEVEVKTIQDYMKGLSMFKKGDSTKIKVKRGNEEKVLDVTF
ncbi:MAG: M20/M25/M40 family metallo-hydrolase [Bacteroidota bacterium]